MIKKKKKTRKKRKYNNYEETEEVKYNESTINVDNNMAYFPNQKNKIASLSFKMNPNSYSYLHKSQGESLSLVSSYNNHNS